VLNLKKYKLPAWGEVPVLMCVNRSGIAIFPADLNDPKAYKHSKNVKLDHLAFKVDSENFEKAKLKFLSLDISYEIQDYYYFESIYINNPDDNVVELAIPRKIEGEF
jgi:hypothetical protein